ncbi:MAG: DUF6951 family protein [Cellulosilyticaceae bacterium]
MVRVEFNPGICGLKTVIEVTSEDMQMAKIKIDTGCENIKRMAQALDEVDAFEACLSKVGDSQVFELARKYCKHPSCAIVSAILKGVEVECGLALEQQTSISVNKIGNE